jgi:hypothetical protein
MLSQPGQSTRKSSLLPTSELLNQIVSLEGLQHYCAVKEPADKVMARILLGDQSNDSLQMQLKLKPTIKDRFLIDLCLSSQQ